MDSLPKVTQEMMVPRIREDDKSKMSDSELTAHHSFVSHLSSLVYRAVGPFFRLKHHIFPAFGAEAEVAFDEFPNEELFALEHARLAG